MKFIYNCLGPTVHHQQDRAQEHYDLLLRGTKITIINLMVVPNIFCFLARGTIWSPAFCFVVIRRHRSDFVFPSFETRMHFEEVIEQKWIRV